MSAGRSEPVVSLTDEELVLLNAVHPAVLQPYLDTVPEGSRSIALATAYRSLRVHGLAPGSAGTGLAVPEGLVQLLQARECAEAVLIVCRTDGDDERLCYCHLCEPAVIIEELDREGIHTFQVVHDHELAAALQEFAQGDCGAGVHLEARVWAVAERAEDVCRIGPDDLADAGRRIAGLLTGATVGHNKACDNDF
ncbi:hypothetical protein [Leekyejoonella antrihumi]|uniref:Uncharacterized protein n=1 Tax=Leekyejoonella antrihumi TaxID=1660198 RepID=A0A563DWM8_9MICO|nr:hypothetical protein [Leekyejoonella antrihumi]TWP34371.1 hypothetical protein FGL98_17470 [Leekyejoonella antrihumi]